MYNSQDYIKFYITRNNIPKLKEYLNSYNINDLIENNNNYLIYAITMLKNSYEVCQLLIDCGINVNAVNDYGETALSIAIKTNQENLIKLLTSVSGVSLEQVVEYNDNVLFDILVSKNNLLIKQFIKNECYKDKLFYLLYDQLKCANFKFFEGLDEEVLNITNQHEETLLMKLITQLPLEFAKQWLSFNIDVNKKNKKDRDALIYLCERNEFNVELFYLLIKKGAHVNTCDVYQKTALMYAIEQQNEQLAKLLIDQGADVNANNDQGKSVLMFAAEKSSLFLFKYLIEKGADVTKIQHTSRFSRDIEKYLNHDEKTKYNSTTFKEEEQKANRNELTKEITDLLNEKYQVVKLFKMNKRVILESTVDKLNKNEEMVQQVINYILYLSIKHNQLSYTKYAISKGANPLTVYRKKDVTHSMISLATEYPVIYNYLLEYCNEAELSIASFERFDDLNPKEQELLFTILTNQVKAASEIIKELDDLNFETQEGMTPIMYALKFNREVIFKELERSGADLFKVSKNNENGLHFAAYGCELKVINYLINRGVSINQADKAGKTPLFNSVVNEYFDVFEKLFEFTEEKYQKNFVKNSILHHIVKESTDEFAHKALNLCHDFIEAINNKGDTPLIIAFKEERIDLIKELIQLGANVNVYNEDLVNPLYIAVKQQNRELVDLLLEHGASKNFNYKKLLSGTSKNVPIYAEYHQYILDYKVQEPVEVIKEVIVEKVDSKYEPLINLFKEEDEDAIFNQFYHYVSDCEHKYLSLLNVNYVNKIGNNLLIQAVINKDLKMLNRLLLLPVDINHLNQKKMSALMYACINGDIEMVRLLIKHHAKINLISDEQMNSMNYAIKDHHKELIKLLINEGACLYDEQFENNSLHYALKYASNEVLDLILSHITNLSDILNERILSYAVGKRAQKLQKLIVKKEEAQTIPLTGKGKVCSCPDVHLMVDELNINDMEVYFVIVEETDTFYKTFPIFPVKHNKFKVHPVRIMNKTYYVLLEELVLIKKDDVDSFFSMKDSYYLNIMKEYSKENFDINDLNLLIEPTNHVAS